MVSEFLVGDATMNDVAKFFYERLSGSPDFLPKYSHLTSTMETAAIYNPRVLTPLERSFSSEPDYQDSFCYTIQISRCLFLLIPL